MKYPQIALDAARVTRTILSSRESGEPIVVHSRDYQDPELAAGIALEAVAHPGPSYTTISVLAHQDIHGLEVSFSSDADRLALAHASEEKLIAVVTIASSYPVTKITAPALVARVQRPVEELAEDHNQHDLRFIDIVCILDVS